MKTENASRSKECEAFSVQDGSLPKIEFCSRAPADLNHAFKLLAMPESEDFEPLPSIIDTDFEHEKMLDFGLPLHYSDIDWRDSKQRDGYVLFVIWFLEQLLEGGLIPEDHEETPEIAALRANLDQLHAEMRENALKAGLDLAESPAPFAELD